MNSLKRSNSSRKLTSSDEGDELIITPLGAGSEVGRSCVHMTYKGKTVLFDCGIHPGFSGMSALPYFDEIDPEAVDVLLITHGFRKLASWSDGRGRRGPVATQKKQSSLSFGGFSVLTIL